MPSRADAARHDRMPSVLALTVVGLVTILALAPPGVAAVLECAAADVACLIAAINTANASGTANTIRLQSGTYTLTAPDNAVDGSNGLPSITSPLTIAGAGAGGTIIERDASGPDFRLFHVGQRGVLKLQGVTVRGGKWGGPSVSTGGGALLNLGATIISDSVLTANVSNTEGIPGGGAISSLGRLVIARSIISNNRANIGFGGGVSSRADLTVLNSTISGNLASDGGGGLWAGDGTMTIVVGSTIADNRAVEGFGGGLLTGSTGVAVINSTFADNESDQGFGGGLAVAGGGIILSTTIAGNEVPGGPGQALSATSALALHNTIVGGPSQPGFPACFGAVTSLGNNIFIDPACAVALLADDLTGDPGLADFVNDGTPGHGFFPLQKRSPALNAGDDAACPPTDQRGQRRNRKGCDIGATEGTHP